MKLLSGIETRVLNVGTLISSGLIRPMRPDHLVRFGRLYLAWGPTPALGYMVGALTRSDETAVIDELGALTFAEMNRRTNALAHALADDGVGEGDRVAMMCRNHRGFIDATVALSKLGAHCLYLNTSFAGPQITDVVKREDATAIIYDQEFTNLVVDAAEGRKTYLAWVDAGGGEGNGEVVDIDDSLDHLIRMGDPSDPVPPSEPGKTVILTSGTTGTPKGASRQSPTSLDPAAALLSKIPLHAGEVTMVAAPLFHAWGFAHFVLAMGLGSTIVLRRKFDPEQTLAATAEHRATALAVVPVMLQRTLELPEEVRGRYDLRALRAIAVSGSALPGRLATATMDAFGDIVYNLYGSTEVAWATIATPEDLRAAPGTAGRPPRGTIVKLYDEDGKEVPQGDTARIFVGNEMMFEGYTGGGGKEVINGLMATGDVGHFDRGGRLHVDGRDDDMIVSGGENVFPAEVEDLLAGHKAVADVAVFGVDDEKFGQRLKAVVVKRKGQKATEKELKDYVKANLAGYKVPREIAFTEELPRTATGKILKRELA
ncbi:MAG TPA: AMP-binding protein [Solirubrobacteraceae bacterium]|nr:AMP-binding protein [Solirubrobacteraceae bacterium]